MTALDAYAVISYLRDEAAADEVATLLREPTLLPAANHAEIIDQLVRIYHRVADDVEADLALLCHAGMDVAILDAPTATLAGRLRAHHYHRKRCAVSLADCVAAGTAIMHDRPLATADPALADLLRAEHGKIIGLPDSKRPPPLTATGQAPRLARGGQGEVACAEETENWHLCAQVLCSMAEQTSWCGDRTLPWTSTNQS